MALNACRFTAARLGISTREERGVVSYQNESRSCVTKQTLLTYDNDSLNKELLSAIQVRATVVFSSQLILYPAERNGDDKRGPADALVKKKTTAGKTHSEAKLKHVALPESRSSTLSLDPDIVRSTAVGIVTTVDRLLCISRFRGRSADGARLSRSSSLSSSRLAPSPPTM